MIPHWAKDAKSGAKMINAKAETLLEPADYGTDLQPPLLRQRIMGLNRRHP